MNIQFFTPSYKRAKTTEIDQYLKNVHFCVHDFEAEEYKKYHDNVIVMPDELRWNMARVRNFILDYARRNWIDVCVMLDDDVEYIGYFEEQELYKITEGELVDKIFEWSHMAEDFGTVLFWLNLQSDPKFYREYSPFSLLSPVLWPFMCILTKGNFLRFDERLGLNEDYDFSLQVLQKHHKIFRNNKFHYRCGHLTDKGGCGAYRVLDEEKRQAEVMIRKWGSKVVSYDFEKSTNPRINCPLKGI